MRLREERYAGWGGDARHGDPRRRRVVRVARGRVAGRRDRPAAVSGQAGAARERRQPASGPPTRRAGRRRRRPLTRWRLVLGIDVSTTATKAVLIDEAGAVVGVGTAEYGFEPRSPLWSEQDPQLWWDGAIGGDPLGPGRRPGVAGAEVDAVGLTGQMHGLVLLDAADASSGRRSCGTTSGRPPNATRSAPRSAPSGSSRSPATTR